MNRGAVLFHRFFLNDAQHMQRGRFGRTDEARTTAARARLMGRFAEARAQSLTRQLHQAKARDLAHLNPGAVHMQRITQAVFHLALIAGVFHVDEVDHDQSTQIAQTQLTGGFFGRFAVGAVGGFLDVMTTRGAGRVHIYRYQCFGMVDDDGATRGQRHLA